MDKESASPHFSGGMDIVGCFQSGSAVKGLIITSHIVPNTIACWKKDWELQRAGRRVALAPQEFSISEGRSLPCYTVASVCRAAGRLNILQSAKYDAAASHVRMFLCPRKPLHSCYSRDTLPWSPSFPIEFPWTLASCSHIVK